MSPLYKFACPEVPLMPQSRAAVPSAEVHEERHVPPQLLEIRPIGIVGEPSAASASCVVRPKR